VDRAGHPDGSIETQTETLIARRERFTLQFYFFPAHMTPAALYPVQELVHNLTSGQVGVKLPCSREKPPVKPCSCSRWGSEHFFDELGN
jgi:hypothetical protein